MRESIVQVYINILNEYKNSNKKLKDKYYLSFIFYRHICFPLVALFLKLGITANTVTLFGFISLVIAFSLIALGTESSFIFGGGFYFLAFILDFADGTLARYINKPNYFGKLIDGLVDYFSHLLYFFIGLGLYKNNSYSDFDLNWILIGSFMSMIVLFLIYFRIRILYFTQEESISSKDNQQEKKIKEGNKNTTSFTAHLNRASENFIVLCPILLLIFVFANNVDLFILIYFLFFIVLFIFEVPLRLYKFRKFTKIERGFL